LSVLKQWTRVARLGTLSTSALALNKKGTPPPFVPPPPGKDPPQPSSLLSSSEKAFFCPFSHFPSEKVPPPSFRSVPHSLSFPLSPQVRNILDPLTPPPPNFPPLSIGDLQIESVRDHIPLPPPVWTLFSLVDIMLKGFPFSPFQILLTRFVPGRKFTKGGDPASAPLLPLQQRRSGSRISQRHHSFPKPPSFHTASASGER